MPTPTFETITLEVEEGVALLTLNRPEKLNAFNTQMMRDMIAAFDLTDADDAVRAVIVTGAGRGSAPARTSRPAVRPSTTMRAAPRTRRRASRWGACRGTAAGCSRCASSIR